MDQRAPNVNPGIIHPRSGLGNDYSAGFLEMRDRLLAGVPVILSRTSPGRQP
jgi:hypothetical protein